MGKNTFDKVVPFGITTTLTLYNKLNYILKTCQNTYGEESKI